MQQLVLTTLSAIGVAALIVGLIAYCTVAGYAIFVGAMAILRLVAKHRLSVVAYTASAITASYAHVLGLAALDSDESITFRLGCLLLSVTHFSIAVWALEQARTIKLPYATVKRRVSIREYWMGLETRIGDR